MADDAAMVIVEALRPVGLGDRGQALWDAFGGDDLADAARAVLVAEAARLADMLELLDGLIRGDSEAWATIEVPETGQTSKLVINGAVSERRQTVTVLRHTIAQLTMVAAVPGEAEPPKPVNAEPKGLDEITRKRNARRSAATAE